MATAKNNYQQGDKIGRLQTNLEKPTAVLTAIGAMITAESQRAFKLQRFGVHVWRERAKVNRFGIIADFAAGNPTPPKRRFQPRPALRDTGMLARSIGSPAHGGVFTLSRTTVTVGTNIPYAQVHQDGGAVESEIITEKVQLLLGAWLLKPSTTEEAFEAMAQFLNKRWRGRRLKGEVPARPFIGLTKQMIQDIHEVAGVTIAEAR